MKAPLSRSRAHRARRKLLAERATCIGGSDAIHLAGQAPFGCRRRLFYEKAQVAADFPFEGNHHTQRGEALEATARRVYAEQAGRTVGTGCFTVRPDRPHMGVHIDGEVLAEGRDGAGVLELKCPTWPNWCRIKANGCPLDFVMQCQWGMAVTGWKWGSVGVFTAEIMKALVYDFDRDDGICASFAPLADQFWDAVRRWRENQYVNGEVVEVPEPRLEPSDRRCQTCPWRKTCQGLGAVPTMLTEQEMVELTDKPFDQAPELASAASVFLQLQREKREVEAMYDEAKAKLMAAVGERRVDTGLARVWVSVSVSNRKAQPARTQTSRTLRVVPTRPEEELL